MHATGRGKVMLLTFVAQAERPLQLTERMRSPRLVCVVSAWRHALQYDQGQALHSNCAKQGLVQGGKPWGGPKHGQTLRQRDCHEPRRSSWLPHVMSFQED